MRILKFGIDINIGLKSPNLSLATKFHQKNIYSFKALYNKGARENLGH